MYNLKLYSYKDDLLELSVKWKCHPKIRWNDTKIDGVLHLWHGVWDKLVVSTTDADTDAKIHDFYINCKTGGKRLSGRAVLENDFERWRLIDCVITNYEIIDEIRLIELMFNEVDYENNAIWADGKLVMNKLKIERKRCINE